MDGSECVKSNLSKKKSIDSTYGTLVFILCVSYHGDRVMAPAGAGNPESRIAKSSANVKLPPAESNLSKLSLNTMT